MTITYIHYIIAFLAILLHVLTRLEAIKAKGAEIDWRYFVNRNWVNVAMAVISIVLLFMMLDDLIAVSLPGSTSLEWGSRILAFMVGWFNYSFIRHIVGLFKKQSGIGGADIPDEDD